MFTLLLFLALKSSHSWQSQKVPRQALPHHSRTSTKLDFSIGDVDLTALTTSATLFVGAAGTLLYSRMAMEKRKQQVAEIRHSLEKDSVVVEAQVELENELSQDLKEQEEEDQAEVDLDNEISQVLKEEAADVTVEESSVVPTEASNAAVMEKSAMDKPAMAVVDPTVKTDSDETFTVSAGMVEMDTDAPSKDDVSTVGAPKIVPTAEERAVETLSRDKSAEPSFTSYLESSQKAAGAVKDEPIVQEAIKTKPETVANAMPKQEEPVKTTVVAKEPSDALNVASPAEEQTKEASNGQPLQVKSAPVKEPEEESVSTQASTSKDVPEVKEPPKSVTVPATPVVKETPKMNQAEKSAEPIKSVSVPASPKVVPKVEEPIKSVSVPAPPKVVPEVKEPIKTVSMPASPEVCPEEPVKSVSVPDSPKVVPEVKEPVKSFATPASPKVVPKVKEPIKSFSTPAPPTVVPKVQEVVPRTTIQQVSKPPRPQTTKDILRGISTPSSNSLPTTDKRPARPVVARTRTAATEKKNIISNVASKASFKNSLSLLTKTSAKYKNDEDKAFDSLQQYIQDKARDMTLKRMGGKVDWLSDNKEPKSVQVFRPIVKEETKVLEPDASTKSDEDLTDVSNDSSAELPVFFAPVVDDPYKKSKIAPVSIASEEPDEVVTSPETEAVVAKSLKKRPSLKKKARKSVVLMALATSAVVVGKRLATVVIERGML